MSAGLHDRVVAALARAREGRLEQARSALDRLARAHPADAGVAAALGFVLARMGRTQPAIHHLERALRASPDDPRLLTNLGQLLVEAERPDEGLALLERAADAAPDDAEMRHNLVAALVGIDRMRSAASRAEAALERWPDHERLALGAAIAQRAVGRADRAAATLRTALARRQGTPLLHSALASTLNYVSGVSAEEVHAAHLGYGAALDAGLGRGPCAAEPMSHRGRRLRLGILSGELVSHPVAFFLAPLLRALDRERFEVFLFYTALREDDTTRRLRGMGTAFRAVGALDAPGLDGALRADRLDVLLELSGHTAYHRLPALRFRPAPLQGTYLGYPNTTGVSEVDFRIVDSLTDPPGAERPGVERLVRLDPCFLCYEPPPDAPEPRDETPDDAIVFGSFNSLAKLSEACVELWSRLLARVEGSRLTLKDNALCEAAAGDEVRARFAAHGVAPARITTLAKTPSLGDHLRLYNTIDVALDPFPYNGVTTTCEATLMGVPVVTLEGSMHAGRVGLSLLTNMGLTELIARTPDEWIEKAAALAGDEERRRAMRSSLRGRMLASPLCDADAFARRFGETIARLFEERVTRGRGAGR